MRLHEILTEAATAPLYHGTTFASALEIVRDGALRAYTSIPMDGKAYYGLSTSRSPRMSHIDHDPDQKASEKDTIEGFNVIFVLDQAKIRQHYKVIPFDFFKGNSPNKWFHKEVNKLRDARSESEEFIVIGKSSREKMPIAGYVTKIICFDGSFKNPDDSPDVDTFIMFRKFAMEQNIPVIFDRTLFGFSDNERPWNDSLRQSMITHADKNDIKVDPKDFLIKQLVQLLKKYDKIDGQNMNTEELSKAFSDGERFAIWNFWLQMNNRPPAIPRSVVSDKVMAIVFKAIKKGIASKDKIIYRKGPPLVFSNTPKTPEEKKAAGLAKSKK